MPQTFWHKRNTVILKFVWITRQNKNLNTLIFLSTCKQSVYKQLAFRWQILKQLSGLNHLSLSNNKNYRSKFFLCNKHKIPGKPKIHKNSAVSKALMGKT